MKRLESYDILLMTFQKTTKTQILAIMIPVPRSCEDLIMRKVARTCLVDFRSGESIAVLMWKKVPYAPYQFEDGHIGILLCILGLDKIIFVGNSLRSLIS